MERYISCIFVFTKKYKAATMMTTLIKERNMPVERRWYKFTHEKIESIPKGLRGAYGLGNKDKKVIYVGSSDSPAVGIRGRLLTHLAAHLTYNKFPTAKYFRYAVARTLDDPREMEIEAVHKYSAKPKHIIRTPRKRKTLF
jgi:hypothetical protein